MCVVDGGNAPMRLAIMLRHVDSVPTLDGFIGAAAQAGIG